MIEAARVDQHAIPHHPEATLTRTWRNTGLYDAQQINWRLAEPYEVEVKQRAFDQQREKDAALVRIPKTRGPDTPRVELEFENHAVMCDGSLDAVLICQACADRVSRLAGTVPR